MGCGGDEGGGGRSCHLNFWGGCTMRDRYIGGEGTNTERTPSALEFSECSESGVFRVLGVFVFLCPDINFMSAILGQNTKYVF